MKKNILAVLLIMTLISGIGFAEPLPKRTWQLTPEVYHFNYREPNIAVEVNGVMFGLTGSYTKHVNRFMWRLEGRGAFGEVDYASDSSGSSDNISDYVLEGRALAGYDFIDEESHWYTVYSGFGYRYLNDGGGGTVTTTGALGYDRESNYFYLPIGVEMTQILTETWNISAMAEFDYLLKGQQRTHLSTALPLLNDVTTDQNRGFGFRTSLHFQYASEKYDISFGPFFRWWKIDASEAALITYRGVAAGYGIEPSNETQELGADLSVLF